jgi:hypothetical protein
MLCCSHFQSTWAEMVEKERKMSKKRLQMAFMLKIKMVKERVENEAFWRVGRPKVFVFPSVEEVLCERKTNAFLP